MSARRPLIVGNWKMHGTRAEAEGLILTLKAKLASVAGREVVVAPPFTVLETVSRLLAGSAIRWAGQNLHWEPKGAFTGEVSGSMLKELGCTYVIIGHSERRQYFGETDESVRRKVLTAQREGLLPIVCVGETLAERDQGETLVVIERQVHGALQEQEKAAIKNVVIAYEPVWAIGTGRTATPAQAQEVHAAIRRLLAESFGQESAGAVCILYGGSVKPDNIDGLMAEDEIDGVLVGGASLEADSFARIVNFQ